jgi:multiple sugar transport system permease protein
MSRRPVVATRRRLSPLRRREALLFYLFISPWVVGFVIFLLGPMVASVYLSLTDWDSFTDPVFIGLDNYVRLITDDPIFWISVGNTFFYALLAVPLGMVIALWLANLLNKQVRLRRFFRTVIYLPALVPIVAGALIFKMVLAPDAGILNRGLALLGITGPHWLLDPFWVKPSIILLSLWGTGGATVLLLAAMKGIPRELYEAAELDGAGGFHQFWTITVPQVTPVLFFNLILGLIGAFQVFGQVYIMTGGGPDNAIQMIVPMLFDEAFEFFHMGYASAMSWILFLIVLVFTIIAFRTSRWWVFYESEVDR